MSNPNARHGWIGLGLVVALLAGFLVAQLLPPNLLGFRRDHDSADTAMDVSADDGQLYTCGMHPHVIEDAPGSCPICGMDLVPIHVGDGAPMNGKAGHDHGEETPAAASWTCTKHPMITEDGPGACPIDGLPLVMAEPVPPDSEAAGTTVRIDPAVIQNMNVRTARVVRQDLTQPIRTVGYLEYDQQRMVTVTTKYAGWVEKVYVNYVGETVRRGQPLFEVYAPELIQTQEELLSALRFAGELGSAPEDAQRRAQSLVESARTRLGYWDVSKEQIARLEATGEVFRTLTVSAPSGGMVMKRIPGLEGMAVRPGMEIFHIANLSSLWLSAELFEGQMAWVREGTEARITLSYFEGETFTGRVRFLEPALSEQTRTVRAMIEVPNRGGRLRKGMFATVEFAPVVAVDALVVQTQAVLRTGMRNVVVRALGDGRFMPQEVTLGRETGGLIQVLTGLEEGDEVVTSSQFLLDSESTLREAVQRMIAARQEPEP